MLAGKACIESRQKTARDARSAANFLKALLEVEIVIARAGRQRRCQAPVAGDARRHDVQIVILGDVRFAVGFPLGEAVVVRDDPRAGLQLREELGLELVHERRQEIHRDDARLADVGREDVAFTKRDAIGNAFAARQLAALRNELAVDLDADAARAPVAGGGDDDASIARAQVVDDVVRADRGKPQHFVDVEPRRWNVRRRHIERRSAGRRRGKRDEGRPQRRGCP